MNYADIVNQLKIFVEENPDIDAIFAIGSYARDEMEPYSDIDLIIVSPILEPSKIMDSINDKLGSEVKYLIKESERKAILFLCEKWLRVDLYVVKDPLDVKDLFKGSKIADPAKSIIVDKSQTLLSKFKAWNSEPKLEFLKIINEEVNKFLISFESASSAARKEDVFQSYFQYNLALTRLVRLIQLEKDNDSFLYLPKRFMNNLPLWRRDRIERINGSLSLHELRPKIDSLAIEFREAHSALHLKYPQIERSPKEIGQFLNEIQTRDMVWNFRDISWVLPNYIREGCLFRSSSLARYDDKVALSNWLQKLGIKRIIDLRLPHEIARLPYLHLKIEVVNVPMKILPKDQKALSYDSEDNYIQLIDNSKAVSKIFCLLSEGVPTVIHCHAGRDRTAVIIALIELSIGLTEDEVKKDFLASNLDLKKDQLNPLLTKIKSLGGIHNTLKILNVKEIDIVSIQKWLVKQKIDCSNPI